MLILSAPGSGKSTWVRQRSDWIDADRWAGSYGIHSQVWHTVAHSFDEKKIHYQNIDKYLELERYSINIIGSLFWEIVPDAIVIIPINKHKSRVNKRTDLDWNNVNEIQNILLKRAIVFKIPIFNTFNDAATFCEIKQKHNMYEMHGDGFHIRPQHDT